MKEFSIRWGGWLIALVALVILLSFKVINEKNIGHIIESSRAAVQEFAKVCSKGD